MIPSGKSPAFAIILPGILGKYEPSSRLVEVVVGFGMAWVVMVAAIRGNLTWSLATVASDYVSLIMASCFRHFKLLSRREPCERFVYAHVKGFFTPRIGIGRETLSCLEKVDVLDLIPRMLTCCTIENSALLS